MNLFENSLKQLDGYASPEYMKAAAELFTLVEGISDKIPLKATLYKNGERPVAPKPTETADETADETAETPAENELGDLVKRIRDAVSELQEYPAAAVPLLGDDTATSNRLGMLSMCTTPQDLAGAIDSLFQYYPEDSEQALAKVQQVYEQNPSSLQAASQAVENVYNVLSQATQELSDSVGAKPFKFFNKKFKPLHAPNDTTTNRFKRADGPKSGESGKPTQEEIQQWVNLISAPYAQQYDTHDADEDTSETDAKASLDTEADIQVKLYTGAKQIAGEIDKSINKPVLNDFITPDEINAVKTMYKVSKFLLAKEFRRKCGSYLSKHDLSSKEVFSNKTVFSEQYFNVTEYDYPEDSALAGMPSGYITATVREEYRDSILAVLLPLINIALKKISAQDMTSRPVFLPVVRNIPNVQISPDEVTDGPDDEDEEPPVERIGDETYDTEGKFVLRLVPRNGDDIDTLRSSIQTAIQQYKVIGISDAWLKVIADETDEEGVYEVGVSLSDNEDIANSIRLQANLYNTLCFVMSAVATVAYREAINLGCTVEKVGIGNSIRKILEDPAKKKVLANMINRFRSADFRDAKSWNRNQGALDAMQNTSHKFISTNLLILLWKNSRPNGKAPEEVEVSPFERAVLNALSEQLISKPVPELVKELNIFVQMKSHNELPSEIADEMPESLFGRVKASAANKYLVSEATPEESAAEDEQLDAAMDDILTNNSFVEALTRRITGVSTSGETHDTTNFMDTGLTLHANTLNKTQFDRSKYFSKNDQVTGDIGKMRHTLRDISQGRFKPSKPASAATTTPSKPKVVKAAFDGDDEEF